MFPLGHLGTALIIGTILYMPMAAFLIGVFLPDLIDKTLTFFGVLQCSRFFGHTILFTVGVGLVGMLVTRKVSIGLALMLGSMLHLLQDSAGMVPYLYPFVEYQMTCTGINYVPDRLSMAFEFVGLGLIVVWWKFRSKLFYLREKILKLKRLKRVFG